MSGHLRGAALIAVWSWGASGCAMQVDDVEAAEAALELDCDPGTLPGAAAEACRDRRLAEGERLFDEETFGGNGRTCATCHSGNRPGGHGTGTLTLDEVATRLRRHQRGDFDPLFVHDGLDADGVGTTRIATTTTIAISIPLPPGMALLDDPTATSVTVFRTTPTTMNTPALDPVLMWDGRDPSLQAQAAGAIFGHAQPVVPPTPLQLDLIAEFQESAPRFFSSRTLRDFARGRGPAPVLPDGTTESEQRGREMFIDAPWDGRVRGICAWCHGGPMLDTASGFGFPVIGVPPGARFSTVGVSEFNRPGFPLHVFQGTDELGPFVVVSPDPGVLLQPDVPIALPLRFRTNFFKNSILWGIPQTAPYFHDGSATDLLAVARHYQVVFGLFGIFLSEQDVQDMVAFMRLL
jgi:cytochrome c peroxidase